MNQGSTGTESPNRPITQSPERLNAFSAGELEQYKRCPRQYYYGQVLGLRGRESESAFQSYQECLWRALHRIAKDCTRTESAAESYLEEAWAEGGPIGHPHEPVLKERAAEIVRQAAALGGVSPGEITADLGGVTVRIPLDHVEESGGAARLERWRTGKARSDEHTDARYALVRKAARQQGVSEDPEVVIRYLATGEVRVIPEQKAYEPARVARYEAAIEGIRAGAFEPKPESPDLCARCPFFFTCPA